MTLSVTDWLVRLADELGREPPTSAECEALLALAGAAARASERTAAPLSCWLLARAGLSPQQGLDVVDQLVRNIEGGSP